MTTTYDLPETRPTNMLISVTDFELRSPDAILEGDLLNIAGLVFTVRRKPLTQPSGNYFLFLAAVGVDSTDRPDSYHDGIVVSGDRKLFVRTPEPPVPPYVPKPGDKVDYILPSGQPGADYHRNMTVVGIDPTDPLYTVVFDGDGDLDNLPTADLRPVKS